jgi:demethylmenaquinone methyltransferase/2-methoxy-6-polyprenyl-1,4-benzoquinol methylase
MESILDLEKNTSPRGPDAQKIQNIFSSIATGYDKANSVLSLGIHHLWKKNLVRWSGATRGQKVLDCATGTGDLALLFKEAVGDQGHVTGTDFCQEMIDLAPAKAAKKNLKIDFSFADVSELPFADGSFDIASISFGIRNVFDSKKALSELHRVLKPGGRLLILEFGQPDNPVFSWVYRIYSEYLLPKVGGLLTRNKGAYQYLNQSAAHFPCGQNFVNHIKEAADFKKVEFRKLSLGIAFIYRAEK